jgi:glycerate 2-kinase
LGATWKICQEYDKKFEDITMDAYKDLIVDIFRAALLSADPYQAVADQADETLLEYQKGNYERLYLIGFGKGLSPMARAIMERMGQMVSGGVVVTKYGYGDRTGTADSKIRIYEGGHPLPDKNGFRATAELIQLADTFDKRTFVICLISGGGSALLVSPFDAISLEEKRKATDLLLKAGADINELNTVRKHISRVKGGRLAEIMYPARIKSLILSDVIDDRLDVIASGPTSPDDSTYSEAIAVVEKYVLKEKMPGVVLEVLRKGDQGMIPETPKKGSAIFKMVDNIIIGSNKQAVEASQTRARLLGFDVMVLTTELRGEAKKAGRWLAGKAVAAKRLLEGKQGTKKPICLISGGETTVTVRGTGVGGRNMELALTFALEVEGEHGIHLLSAGTDGTDGPTDATGAYVDGQIVKKARSTGINPEEYLANNDSYNFFRKTDGLFITGPTGTNVMDIQIVLLEV